MTRRARGEIWWFGWLNGYLGNHNNIIIYLIIYLKSPAHSERNMPLTMPIGATVLLQLKVGTDIPKTRDGNGTGARHIWQNTETEIASGSDMGTLVAGQRRQIVGQICHLPGPICHIVGHYSF